MPNPNEVATITVGGRSYRNWKTVSVERVWGGEAISVFSLGATEPSESTTGWSDLRLKPGDAVTVALAGITVITGNVTARSTSIDAQGHEILVQGRSAAAKIADTSVPIKAGSFSGNTYEQTARGLLARHGVGLVVRNAPSIFSKPFRSLVPQYGETIMEMLDRMGSMRGVFHSDDADGNLVVGQGDPTAAPVATLQEGKNIKSATVRLVNENAWSLYTVAGQNVGTDQDRPSNRDQSASISNPNTDTIREKILIAPHTGDSDEMAAHANYRAAVDSWNQVQATFVVQGWVRPDGKLWDVCDNLSVIAPSLFPNEGGKQILGVQTVKYTQDSENGTLTTLECVLPNALSPYSNPNVLTDSNGNLLNGSGVGTAAPNAPDTSTSV